MTVTAPRPALAVAPSPHDRIPPQSLEAEMALLGAVLVDREMMDVVSEIVLPSDFYASMHETIYLALFALHGRGAPLDKIALAEELRERGMLDKLGGIAYIGTLMDAVPSAASAEYYARIVRDKATLRDLIHGGTQITNLGYDADDVEGAVWKLEQIVSTIAERGAGVTPFRAGAVLAELRAEMLSDDPVKVALSPWRSLNDAIGGFTPGELVAIVAPAKVGKTGFAVTLSEYIAEWCGPVPFFATEMGDRGIERRRIALRSGVSARRQKRKLFRPGERARAARAAEELREKRLFVLGRDQRSLRAIWRVCREVRKRFGALGGICIDHVGFVEEARSFGKTITETQALDVVYRELLNVADHFDCPVFVVVHPNRDGSMERPSRTTLQKIRGGGALENHAHTILCPWRADPEAEPNKGELIIVAARDGGEGPLPFHYSGARAAWMEIAGDAIVPLWFERETKTQQLELAADAHDDGEEDDLAAYAREHLGEDELDASKLFGS